MRVLARSTVVVLLLAAAGCSSAANGPDRLSLADQPPPAPNWSVSIGSAAHDDAYMNPIDPADQQNNQGHGLAVGPDDPEYFAQFLRF